MPWQSRWRLQVFHCRAGLERNFHLVEPRPTHTKATTNEKHALRHKNRQLALQRHGKTNLTIGSHNTQTIDMQPYHRISKMKSRDAIVVPVGAPSQLSFLASETGWEPVAKFRCEPYTFRVVKVILKHVCVVVRAHVEPSFDYIHGKAGYLGADEHVGLYG